MDNNAQDIESCGWALAITSSAASALFMLLVMHPCMGNKLRSVVVVIACHRVHTIIFDCVPSSYFHSEKYVVSH